MKYADRPNATQLDHNLDWLLEITELVNFHWSDLRDTPVGTSLVAISCIIAGELRWFCLDGAAPVGASI